MKIEFSLDNAAFEEGDDAVDEVRQIFKEVLLRFAAGADAGSVLDSNGNKVGEWEVQP
jgi:hypothetical protein